MSIWPFSRKSARDAPNVEALLKKSLDAPKVAPIPAEKIRSLVVEQFPGRQAVFDGPFPIRNDRGRILCKSCGIPYDEFSLPMALGSIRQALAAPDGGFQTLMPSCGKCGAISFFSPKNLVTGKPDDSLGPWARHDIESVRLWLAAVLQFAPAEALAIPSDRLTSILNIYRK